MKILIFGAGKWGQILQKFIESHPNNILVGFIDNNLCVSEINGHCVYKASAVHSIEYDQIIIAVSKYEALNEIRNQLVDLSVPTDKITSILENEKLFVDVFSQRDNLYNEKTDPRVQWLRYFSKYVEKEKILGSVAECGVYMGDFAAYINKYFATRKLYLFDTFEGFTEQDLAIERNIKDEAFLSGRFNSNWQFTTNNEEIARRKMPYIEQVEFHKGYFPETAKGIKDMFCFVNLDMDLYQPMLAGLEYFYPQMSTGGALLLHDYFREDLPGVKKAVNDYERDHNIYLAKIPIGDECSLAIIKV